ncbi:MAG: YidC/Oxa1 family membrane protein insertase [Lachnospiraceae bacterium]|nr:YidC/Oxa1 family membrane protein insertase [Lachnospiraceae bacterium]
MLLLAAQAAQRTSTVGDWPIIKQIAYLLGFVMRGIFVGLSSMGILNITLCIVLFTIITRMILLPLTIQQQKFSKLNAVMSPELQALQKKYQGKRDQASMSKMQAEQQALYDKYGVSMSAGCLPSLIQIPLLFALYPVVYNMEKYVPELANFSAEELTKMYTIFGIYLKDSPKLGMNASMLIPILAGLAQFLSVQLMSVNQPQMDSKSTMASSMKTMNYTMPLMSVFFCFTFPAFIGVYWITMSVVMVIQQLFINQWLKKVDVDELIKKSVAKRNKKRAKKGLPPINEKANISTKRINTPAEPKTEPKIDYGERAKKIQDSTDYYEKKAAKPGSLAAKAGMVKDYNERHKK